MKNNKGFTLVELLAVIALIAILAVVGIATYRGINESSKNKTLEAKKTQIKAAAEKWARENNITNRTTISVNTLVVEGYITADEVNPSGLATIKNPVTGKNMICNVIEISFENGAVKTIFNDKIEDCKLANQSLDDTKINITIKDSANNNLTGTGSIAKWTNKDIVVIVNSNEYDTKATSISYDFEGNTVTKDKTTLQKYEGTDYMSKEDTTFYYNVFYIESELILNTKLIVTYEIPGEGTKSREYTIRFDKEEATASLKENSDWSQNNQSIEIKVEDGKGSGPLYYYISTDPNNYEESSRKPASYKTTITNLEVGKYYIWTEDNAGNRSTNYKLEVELNNVDKITPGCEIMFSGTEGLHNWYISPVTPSTRNTPAASVSGVNIGLSNTSEPTYSNFAAYNTQTTVTGPTRNTETTRAGVDYFCHVRSLAGKTDNATRNLKIDMTPPTVTLDITSDNNYTQTKQLHFTVTDNLSGIDRVTTIFFQWQAVDGTGTGLSSTMAFDATPGASTTTDLYIVSRNMTGIYYLYVDVTDVHDYAGNYATSLNGGPPIVTLGPYYFDNRAPSCNVGSISQQCTTGGVSCVVTCTDEHSGVATCPGAQSGLKSSTTFTATDQAGNVNTCGINISSTTQYNKQNCSKYHKYNCNCGWTNASDDCWQTDTYESHDTDTVRIGCTGCYDYSTCRKSYQCCRSRYVCDTCTDYSQCDGWGNASAWQNNQITGCNYPDCKVNSRKVYHSGGTCSAGNYSGTGSCINTGLSHGQDVQPYPSVCN